MLYLFLHFSFIGIISRKIFASILSSVVFFFDRETSANASFVLSSAYLKIFKIASFGGRWGFNNFDSNRRFYLFTILINPDRSGFNILPVKIPPSIES